MNFSSRGPVTLLLFATLFLQAPSAVACVGGSKVTTDSPTLYIDSIILTRSSVELTVTFDALGQPWRKNALRGNGLVAEFWVDTTPIASLGLPGLRSRQVVTFGAPLHITKGVHLVAAALKDGHGKVFRAPFSDDTLNSVSRCIIVR